MDEGYYMALAKVRMDRAEELLIEAKDLLENHHINLQITELFMQLNKV